MEKINIKCWGEFKPTRGTEHSAGIDLYNNGSQVIIYPDTTIEVKTKTSISIPEGYVGLVYVRSGLGFKGLDLVNSCGVIDADYRGEIGLKFIVHRRGVTNYDFERLAQGIKLDHGERVAQIVIVPYLQASIEFVDELDDTERGANGFGSTGRF